jgi:hypothetical protein
MTKCGGGVQWQLSQISSCVMSDDGWLAVLFGACKQCRPGSCLLSSW